jgi:hypothetical protein
MTLLAFLLRNWRAVAAFAAVALLTILIAVRTGERDQARGALAREQAAAALFAERVRTAAARIRAVMAARALDVERRQTQVTKEVSNDYQNRIRDLDRRVAALRLRERTAAANPSGAGRPAGLPVLSDAAGGPDAAAGENGLPAEPFGALRTGDAILATEQAIRLEELQNWVRRQAEVEPLGR